MQRAAARRRSVRIRAGSGALAFLLATGMASAQLAPELAPFEPFVGRTWKALVNAEKQVWDVARWDVALAGRAVRIRHSVADGAYGGETIVMWDRETETFVFTYFTTAGFLTRGTMSFDASGRLTSIEKVMGNRSGVREVRATQELTAEGGLLVRTRKLRGQTWEDADEVVYVEDPEAEVRLSATAQAQ